MSNPEIAPAQVEQLQQLVQDINEVACDATVVLIGSAVRGSMTWRSDIDVMVITSDPLPRFAAPPQIHLHPETRTRFLTRLSEGDEFVSWAVRFGRPLRDVTGWWREVLNENVPWPDWRQKLSHIRKRLRTAEAAIKDGDREAAEEELMMAASHCGRAVLLAKGEFPLSRPELPKQLVRAKRLALAETLATLIKGGVSITELKRTFAALNRTFRQLRRTAVHQTLMSPSI